MPEGGESMEDINKILTESSIFKYQLAAELGINRATLWDWIHRAEAGRLEPGKLARLYAGIKNISESRKNP